MKSSIFYIVFFSFLFLSGKLSAQSIDKKQLDSLFDKLQEKNKAMGSLTILQKGNVLYERSTGYDVVSDKEEKTSSADTRYRIGSITKTFTATMIFQLIEEGKLKLYTTLDTYFPDIPYAEIITISNLLNHRSGLHNFTQMDYKSWHQQPKTQEEMLQLVIKGGIDFPTDTKGAYSNSNYLLLGYIIEQLTQQSYAYNLEKRITSPLHLLNTYTGKKIDPKNNECFSYFFNGKWIQEAETDMSILGGAGCIVSTPTDLTKFIDGLFSFKLVSAKSIETMRTINFNYGMGLVRIRVDDYDGYGHNGLIDNFRSSLYYFPYDGFSIAYCSNGIDYIVKDILTAVVNIIHHKKYTIPAFEIVNVKAEVLDNYAGIYNSRDNSMRITITNDGKLLSSQGEGWDPLVLEAINEKRFKSNLANFEIEFKGNNEMLYKQDYQTYIYIKE